MIKLKENILPISVILLLIFYGVGLVNVLIGNESIMRLSYLNLIISTLVLFTNHKSWNARIILNLTFTVKSVIAMSLSPYASEPVFFLRFKSRQELMLSKANIEKNPSTVKPL